MFQLFWFALCVIHLVSNNVSGMSPVRRTDSGTSSEIIKQCKLDYALSIIKEGETDEVLYSHHSTMHVVYSECIKTKSNKDSEFKSKGDINMKMRVGLQLTEENKQEFFVVEPLKFYEICKSQRSETITTLWEYNCYRSIENTTITTIHCNHRCYAFDRNSHQLKKENMEVRKEEPGKYEVWSVTTFDNWTKQGKELRLKKKEEFKAKFYNAIAIYTDEM